MIENYQETLNDKWNDVARQVQTLHKRLDAQSEKIQTVFDMVTEIKKDMIRKRSAEF